MSPPPGFKHIQFLFRRWTLVNRYSANDRDMMLRQSAHDQSVRIICLSYAVSFSLMSTVLGTQKKNSYFQLIVRNQKLVYTVQSPIQGHTANLFPVLGIKYFVSNSSVSFIKELLQISLPSYKYSSLEIVLCERADLSNQIFLHCLTAWSFQLPKGGLHLYYYIILFQDDHFETQLKTKKEWKKIALSHKIIRELKNFCCRVMSQ